MSAYPNMASKKESALANIAVLGALIRKKE